MVKDTRARENIFRARVKWDVQLPGLAAAAEFFHRHRPPVEVIDRNLRMTEIYRFGHVVCDFRRKIGVTEVSPAAEIHCGDVAVHLLYCPVVSVARGNPIFSSRRNAKSSTGKNRKPASSAASPQLFTPSSKTASAVPDFTCHGGPRCSAKPLREWRRPSVGFHQS